MRFQKFYNEASKVLKVTDQDYPVQLEKRAKEIFDVVDGIDLAEYVLSDGTCIMVNNDHRIISRVFKYEVPKGYYNDPGSGSGYMVAFMGETGAIRARTVDQGKFLIISLVNPITYDQKYEVEKTGAFKVRVDWLSKNYETLDSEEFETEYQMEELIDFLRNRP